MSILFKITDLFNRTTMILRVSSLLILIFVNFEGTCQFIQSVDVDHLSAPITISTSINSPAGYQGRIEKSSLGDVNNTQVVEMYFEHCIPLSIFWMFDTTFTLEAAFPFDLVIYTYLDTVSVSEDPVCTFEYNTIIPIDTFFLAADQIVSSPDLRESIDAISVYPLPTEDFIHFDVPIELRITKLTLMDMTGRVMTAYSPFEGRIDLRDFPAGIYLLRVETDKGAAIRKIIKR